MCDTQGEKIGLVPTINSNSINSNSINSNSIDNKLSAIKSQLDILHTEIDRLDATFHPVLNPPEPLEVSAVGPIDDSAAPLTQKLQEINRSIISAICSISCISNRSAL